MTSQETTEQIAKRKCQASHPSTAGTAPVIRMVNLIRGYEQIQPGWKYWTDYPRVTIRPVPGMAEGETLWVATLWFIPGKPVLVNGTQVSKISSHRDELFWWAQRTVEEFKSISDFFTTGQLGSKSMRWAPQW
ncbi:hypothetical protein [Glutamicibacter sp. NPDC087344]|uniref:hypothetical protein n=1 Tax=Glutamicibacter sp. NPDC087344 TaxID=3363994 RepID=UPI00381CA87E